jgi:hypothetical protein
MPEIAWRNGGCHILKGWTDARTQFVPVPVRKWRTEGGGAVRILGTLRRRDQQ